MRNSMCFDDDDISEISRSSGTRRKIYFAIKQIRFYIVNSLIEFHSDSSARVHKVRKIRTKKVKERRFEKGRMSFEIMQISSWISRWKTWRERDTSRLPSFHLDTVVSVIHVHTLQYLSKLRATYLIHLAARIWPIFVVIEFVAELVSIWRILFSNKSDSIQCVQWITISEIGGWHNDECKRA